MGEAARTTKKDAARRATRKPAHRGPAAAVELLMQPHVWSGDLDLLEQLIDRPAWHARAACRGMGTELFFPADHLALSAARRICAGCPVLAECQQFAVSVPSLKGIWAGTSERSRARARKGIAAPGGGGPVAET
jgi:WhiB family transcriptional regulator, redox-sensing transcriptional regulator